MPDEKWEFIIIFLLGLFVGWMLSQQTRKAPQSRKSSTTYTKTDTGFHIGEEVMYE